jgi:phosphoglycolate phosphatase-like HAD superfamily hydrolase
VLAGYRAGARIVAGLGTGRRAAALVEAGATDVLENVAELPDLVAQSS